MVCLSDGVLWPILVLLHFSKFHYFSLITFGEKAIKLSFFLLLLVRTIITQFFDWENTQTPSNSNKYLRLNGSNATEHRNSISISHVILSVLYSNNTIE